MNKYPLVLPALAMVAGILTADKLFFLEENYPPVFYGILPAIFIILSVILSLEARSTICISIMLFTMGGYSGALLCYHGTQIQLHAARDLDSLDLHISAIKYTESSTVIDAKILPAKKAGLRIYTREPTIQAHTGDRIRCKNKLSVSDLPSNPASFNYHKFLFRNGMIGTIFCFSDDFRFIDRGRKAPLRPLAKLKAASGRQLSKHLVNKDNRSIALAMILGDRNAMNDETRNAFVRTGTIHLLAVSGLHVGIISFILNLLLRPWIAMRSPCREIKLSILLGSIMSYVMLTGAHASAVRAGIMCGLYFIGRSYSQYTNPYNIMAAACITMLVWKPPDLFNPGFQFSFLALTGIFLFYNPFCILLGDPGTFLKPLRDLTAISLSAQLMVAPLSVATFHQFPNFFLPANLATAPVAPCVIISGIGLLLLSQMPFYCHLPQNLASIILNKILTYFKWTVNWVEQWPGALDDHLWQDPVSLIIAYIAVYRLYLHLKFPSCKSFSILLAILLIFISYRAGNIYLRHKQAVLTVYHIKGKSCGDYFYGGYHYPLYRSDNLKSKDEIFNCSGWRINHFIKDTIQLGGPYRQLIYQLGGKEVAINTVSNHSGACTGSVTEYILILDKASVMATLEQGRPIHADVLILDSTVSEDLAMSLSAKHPDLDCHIVAAEGPFIKKWFP